MSLGRDVVGRGSQQIQQSPQYGNFEERIAVSISFKQCLICGLIAMNGSYVACMTPPTGKCAAVRRRRRRRRQHKVGAQVYLRLQL